MIEARSELGYRIIGFVDQEWTGLKNLDGHGYSVLSDFDHLSSFLRTIVVDEIVIALPSVRWHPQAAKIAVLCEEQGIPTWVLSTSLISKWRMPGWTNLRTPL